MTKVVKTTFEEEQKEKQAAWLRLSPYERMERMQKIRMKMRKPGVNYALEGQKVKIIRSA